MSDENVLTVKIDMLHSDVVDMKRAVNELSKAITKLALVEERQSQSHATQKRMLEKLDAMEMRIDALEKADVKQGQAATWVMNAVWGAAGLLCMYIAKMLGLI